MEIEEYDNWINIGKILIDYYLSRVLGEPKTIVVNIKDELPIPKYENPVEEVDDAIFGKVDFETPKAYKIKRADGLVVWIPKQYVDTIMDDRIRILNTGKWLFPLEWKKEVPFNG